jgi:prepilin-type N-terminal cleavage/methylation domain-containing protein
MRRTGFTLVELMIVVVVLGILAAIAIYSYSKRAASAKASEVPGMFAEIKRAQLAYQAETGTYLSTSASETTVYPALLATGEPKRKKWDPAVGSAWANLGVRPPDTWNYCGYTTIAGSAGVAPAGTLGKGIYNNQTPQTQWFYVVAICDLDSRQATNTTYVSSHDREASVVRNDGD